MSEKVKKRVEQFEKGDKIDDYLKDTIKTPPEEPETVPDPDLSEDFEVSDEPDKIEDDSYKDYL